MDNRSDQKLAQAAAQGEENAFVGIVQRYQAMVTGITLGVLGDFAASEDAAQEAFVAAWKNINRLKDPTRLRAWLAQVARNTALTHLRKEMKGSELPPDLIDGNPGPAERVATEEEYRAVHDFISGLPENYRLPILLYYRDEQSTRAVAEALDLSEAAVTKRLSRGRALLREQFSSFLTTAIHRTAPGTAFTIAVAGVIGALTPSSALAASVVSQKTSATSTASTLGIMTTGKLLITAGCALACLPLGYLAHGLLTPDTAQKLNQPLAMVSARDHSISNSIDPELLEEWKTLRAQAGLGNAGLVSLFQTIKAMPDGFKKQVFIAALIADWATESPESGLEFFVKEKWLESRFLAEWLRVDRTAALAALADMEHRANLVDSEVLRALANAPLEDLAIAIAYRGNWEHDIITPIIARRTEDDPEQVKNWILTYEKVQTPQVIGAFLKSWAEIDFEAFSKWCNEMIFAADGLLSGQNKFNDAYLKTVATLEPREMLQQLDRQLTQVDQLEGSLKEAAVGALSQLMESDPVRALRWLGKKDVTFASWDDPFRAEPFQILAPALRKNLVSSPDDILSLIAGSEHQGLIKLLAAAAQAEAQLPVWTWLKEHANDPGVESLTLAVVEAQPQESLAWIEQEPDSKRQSKLLEAMANGLFHQEPTDSSHQLESLLETVDSTFAKKLRLATIGQVNLHESANLSPWIEAFSKTQGEQRITAARSIAEASARRNIVAAAAWVEQLPDPQTRAGAQRGLYQEWAQQNVREAASSLQALPVQERPSAVRGLIGGAYQLSQGQLAPQPDLSQREEALKVLEFVSPELGNEEVVGEIQSEIEQWD